MKNIVLAMMASLFIKTSLMLGCISSFYSYKGAWHDVRNEFDRNVKSQTLKCQNVKSKGVKC